MLLLVQRLPLLSCGYEFLLWLGDSTAPTEFHSGRHKHKRRIQYSLLDRALRTYQILRLSRATVTAVVIAIPDRLRRIDRSGYTPSHYHYWLTHCV
ncbi:Uncharacterised protein [Vibrio cholerae]|nr:Uncharacterised protein [Vibrio cholerae]CSC33828.1 Uncharacterised protein [Vibrio cholerae]